jgi:hypothetical protein
LGARPNFGLLLRWSAALEHVRAFSALPEANVAAFLARFRDTVMDELWRTPELQLIPAAPLDRSALTTAPGWDGLPTIFAFALRRGQGPGARLFGPPEAALVYRLLQTNLMTDWPEAERFGAASRLRIELGQPVSFGRPGGDAAAALRLCVSAPLIVEALAGGEQDVLGRVRCILAKTAWVAGQVAANRGET